MVAKDITNNNIKRVLFIVAKFPIPGFVKTRLAKTIGDRSACDLYTAFLADLTPRLAPHNGDMAFDVRWVFTPDTNDFKNLIVGFYENLNMEKVSFKGFLNPGLVEQQIEELQWARDNEYEQSMIISSDSPHLLRENIEEAFLDLNTYDMVIGPTLDGGYYLLGIKDNWNVLGNVTMSTNHVADDIINNAKKLNKSVSIQYKMTDIDTIEDLEILKKLLNNYDLSFCSNTRREIEKL